MNVGSTKLELLIRSKHNSAVKLDGFYGKIQTETMRLENKNIKKYLEFIKKYGRATYECVNHHQVRVFDTDSWYNPIKKCQICGKELKFIGYIKDSEMLSDGENKK